MKPIFNIGDKVYLTEEDDFNDYEIMEISAVNRSYSQVPIDNFKYKIKLVKGQQTIVRGESEIFPITA